jgi:hypothetical protein
MADRDDNLPETPRNWREYSRMLGSLPMRPLPHGAEARLEARLKGGPSSSWRRPGRPWLVGSLSLAAGALALVVGLNLFSDDAAEAPRANTPPAIVTEQQHKPRAHRRTDRPRPIAPQMSEHAITIDTTPPSELPIPQSRQNDVTTGERRAHGAAGSGVATPRSRQEGPKAP